jgi:hypothetical protein
MQRSDQLPVGAIRRCRPYKGGNAAAFGNGPTLPSIRPCFWASSTLFSDWPVRVGENPNPRSLRNFPAQANGAECLRVACCLATERGVEVCAPIHDAIKIAGPLDRLEADIAATRAAMAEASRIVLAGFELNTDVKIVRWPDRYMDPRGVEMWNRVVQIDRGVRAATQRCRWATKC